MWPLTALGKKRGSERKPCLKLPQSLWDADRPCAAASDFRGPSATLPLNMPSSSSTAASPTPAFATAGPWVGRERPQAVEPQLPLCSGPCGCSYSSRALKGSPETYCPSISLPHLPCPAHPGSRPTAGLHLGVWPFPTHHPARSQPNIHAAHCAHPASSPQPGQLPQEDRHPGTLAPS